MYQGVVISHVLLQTKQLFDQLWVSKQWPLLGKPDDWVGKQPGSALQKVAPASLLQPTNFCSHCNGEMCTRQCKMNSKNRNHYCLMSKKPSAPEAFLFFVVNILYPGSTKSLEVWWIRPQLLLLGKASACLHLVMHSATQLSTFGQGHALNGILALCRLFGQTTISSSINFTSFLAD